MKPLVVIPAMSRERTVMCVTSIDSNLADLMIVDNNHVGLEGDARTAHAYYLTAERNVGVCAAWNAGRAAVMHSEREWLIVCSESMRFLDRGHGFLTHVVTSTAPVATSMYAFHLIAFRRSTLETVGQFDEVFWPGYFGDNDIGRRIMLAGWPDSTWDRDEDSERTVECLGDALAIRDGLVEVDMLAQANIYREKWGGYPPDETYLTPYGDPSLPITHVGGRP